MIANDQRASVKNALNAARNLADADKAIEGKQAAFIAAYQGLLDDKLSDENATEVLRVGYLSKRLNVTPERAEYLRDKQHVEDRPEGYDKALNLIAAHLKMARKAMGIAAPNGAARSEAAKGRRDADPVKAAEAAKSKVEKTLPTEDAPFAVRRAQALAHVDAIFALMEKHLPAAKVTALQAALEVVADCLAE